MGGNIFQAILVDITCPHNLSSRIVLYILTNFRASQLICLCPKQLYKQYRGHSCKSRSELRPMLYAPNDVHSSQSSISSLPVLLTTSLTSSLRSSPTPRLSDMISLALSTSQSISSMINFTATSGTTTYST